MRHTRRVLLCNLAVGGFVMTTPTLAATPAIRRIGFLTAWGPPPPGTPSGLARNLKSHGFEEGRNLVIERRYADGDIEKLPHLARELIAGGAELIIALGNASIAAAGKVTTTVPIVMSFGIAPIEAGFVKSLARPGGNITGNAFYTAETTAKNFELLQEAVPGARRMTLIWNPTRPGYAAFEKVLRDVARERGVKLEFLAVAKPAELPAALQALDARPPDALMVASDMSIIEGNPQIVALTRKHKLPSFGTVPEWVNDGGLFYHGPDDAEALESTARCVARILRGARPQDIPVEQPFKYRFFVNARAAREIGLQLPESIKLRADKVIEE